jgi:hypothetical protein
VVRTATDALYLIAITAFEHYRFLTCPIFSLVLVLTADVVNGVVTVTISNTIIGASDSAIRSAVTSALNAAGFSTPGQAQHIMYCLPPGTSEGWIAYAYINSWLSVYNNEWCNYVSTDEQFSLVPTLYLHLVCDQS